MIESQLRALFTEMAEPGPSQVDTELALRRGRARLRWRRACVAGTPVLAAAAAAVAAFAMGVGPVGPAPGPAATGPTAPRQFNPLIPYISFGWLPPGNSLIAGATGKTVMQLSAGRKPTALGPGGWGLTVAAAGRCDLTNPARDRNCPIPEGTAQIRRAPAVRGHPAFWAGKAAPALLWQYARDGWALLVPPRTGLLDRSAAKLATLKRQAVTVARHVRYSAATPPLVFPIRLTRLPQQWSVSSTNYVPDAGVLRVSSYALASGAPDLGADGGLVYDKNLPWFEVDPATPRNTTCFRGPGERSTPEIINGYRVLVTYQTAGTHPRQDLCAANADGLAIRISEIGPHPAISVADLFRHHLRLLGTNPANWTTNPIG